MKALNDASSTCQTNLLLTVPRLLQAEGMLDSTVLVVAGDNGGLPHAAGNNFPLRGHKAELWEGGIRNSALIYSPSLIPVSHPMYGGEYWGKRFLLF